MKKRSVVLVLVLLGVLLLSACQVETDRGEKPGPDWSRGLRLGRTTQKQPVALRADGGGHVHLVWVDEGTPSRLRYAHLDAGGRVLLNEQLDIRLPSPRKPQLVVDRENRVHLGWLSREQNKERLYHTLVESEGGTGEIRLLSGEGNDVDQFRLYVEPEGTVAAIWAGELQDGSSGVHYSGVENPDARVTLIQAALDPAVVVDKSGRVHLVWLTERSLSMRTLYYAELTGRAPELSLVPADGIKLEDISFPDGGIYYGPEIGLDERHVYVFWSVQNLGGGLTPTSAFAYYVTFEISAPPDGPIRTRVISVPTATRPDYAERAGLERGLAELAEMPSSAAYGSDFVNTPVTVTGQGAELPVAYSVLTESRAESQIRVASVLLSDGAPVGYQLASQTSTASLMPALAEAPGPAGGLHLTWLDTEGFKEYAVFYATTVPEARRWLDRTSNADLALSAGELVFGVFSGLGLLPIAGVWTFPALIWVVGYFIATGHEDLVRLGTQVGFAVAVLIYVAVKILLLPGLFIGTPFLHRVPAAWAVVLGIAVPSVLLAVALGVVYLYSRRAERATIFVAYLIFALTDVGLTLVLYSPGFFGSG
jgi:hypothetical protein